jgi:hypothetical protein
MVATSELSRALQALQMALNMVFLLIAVALVMTRLGSVRRKVESGSSTAACRSDPDSGCPARPSDP